jgi:hypothetical protein
VFSSMSFEKMRICITVFWKDFGYMVDSYALQRKLVGFRLFNDTVASVGYVASNEIGGIRSSE